MKATRTTWHPHLSFGGDCRAAFDFYAGCLGGRVVISMTWGESPYEVGEPRMFKAPESRASKE
jgi:uncharacterized glyoxalase superfamily protein PhnB